jgi:hypothetical protein
MSNPFSQNPWQPTESGPAYGNAYEDDQAANTTNQTKKTYNSAYSTYQYNGATANNNYSRPTWESNKVEYQPNNGGNAWDNPTSPQMSNTPVQQSMPIPQDAYQFTGTPYGNQPPQAPANLNQKVEADNNPTPAVEPKRKYHTPTKWRFWYRLLTLITSVGHLGFAAGARPVS